MIHDKGTGRPCPRCGSPMADLRSMSARLCSNGRCGLATEWNLAPGQPPLLGSNRVDRKEKPE